MGSRSWAVLSFLSLCSFAQITSSMNTTSCNDNDLEALRGFLKGLESQIHGWDSNSSDCCAWEGVTCESVTKDSNVSPRVVSVVLAGKRLTGMLSKTLADLVQLRTIDLSHNFFGHSLPIELFNLQNLETLDLSYNDFTGPLPAKINLPSLQYLDISANSLSGSINGDICKTATQLQVLSLSSNYFNQSIPMGIGNCSFLEHLSFGFNFMEGNLPDDLFKLPRLSQLDVQDNRLSGHLSSGFGKLSNLVKLDISSNGFFGILPDAFQNLRKLKQFSAMSNRFVGQLPHSLTHSPSISTIELRNNSLTGSIVLNCSAMVSLTLLDLGSNQFNGPVPDNLYSCQQLTSLNLARNDLQSQLPDSFKRFKSLSHLSLSNNSLYNLPQALAVLQHCRNLTTLVLTLNFHGEVMPADLNLRFDNLQTLVMANCRITGLLPTWLSNCPSLQLLDLSWNHLSGSIPHWLGQLKFLFYLDLSSNSLSEDIPRSLTVLQSLVNQNFSLEYRSQGFKFSLQNKQDGRVLNYSQIRSFPPSLDLSYNMLTGPIWPEFGNLKQLHVLDLGNNNLSGPIPSALSGMTNLESLDLSYNNLSGSIPLALTNLSFLSKFSVAHNKLSGAIPSGGQFSTFPDSSFEGNEGLCMQFSSCGPDQSPSESPEAEESTIIGLPFVFGAVVGFVVIVTTGFVSGWSLPKAEKRRGTISITQWR